MHLKLKIHLNALGRRGPFVGAVLVLLAAAAAAAASSLQLSTTHQENLTTERACRPVLNFGLPQARGSAKAEATEGNSLSQSIPDRFSFAIGDISLPLLRPDGAASGVGSSVQTAMKLLAAFDSQLGAGDDDDEGDDDDGNEGQPRENAIKFLHNKLSISGLNFTMLNVHLYPNGEPKFALGVNIEDTILSGQFLYDGPTPASLLLGGNYAKLAGHYRMTIDNVLVTAHSNLTKVDLATGQQQEVPGGGTRSLLENGKLRFRLATNELRMNITNLGYIAIDILDAEDASRPTSNYVLKMLQRVLQKTIKRTYNSFEEYIRRTLELEGRKFLDCELSRFSPLLSENSAGPVPSQKGAKSLEFADATATMNSTNKLLNSTYLEDVARIVSAEMANSRLSRIGLPDFEYHRSLFGSLAHIKFSNGSLAGLDNIKLVGETRVKLLEESLMVNASLGWFNLRPHYNWTLSLGGATAAAAEREPDQLLLDTKRMGQSGEQQQAGQNSTQVPPLVRVHRAPMASGFVAFNIRAVDFDAVISKSVRSQSRMLVEELTIRRLETPRMDIGGLPGMNRLTRGVVNFFMGRLKQRLVSSIQPALKQELERALNRLALFN